MSLVTITIDSADFPFVMEAIRARSNALLGAVTAQVTSQVTAQASPKEEPVKVAAPEKPAKKAPAEAQEAPKSAEAPWGYKKDGTPRGKPGRKV